MEKSGIDLNSIDYFVFNNYDFSYQKETLELLGIPEHKIIRSIDKPYIQAKKLIVPAPNLFQNDTTTPEWICNFIKQKLLPETAKNKTANRHIYINRKNAISRNVVNQDELMKQLESLNFESVVLESLTISEQAELMASASVVLAPMEQDYPILFSVNLEPKLSNYLLLLMFHLAIELLVIFVGWNITI